MKALVTGATGFLGAAVTARLRAGGVAVRALVRGGRRGTAADEECVGDLCDADSLARAVDGVDWVVHAGARVSTAGAWEEFEAVNVRGTEALIERALAAGVRRIVHVSSLSVFAVGHDGATIEEDGAYEDAAEDRGGYARSKLAADQFASAAMRRGAPIAVVRPGLLFGPGRLPPLARRSAALGPLRLILTRPDYLLPLAYVENVADAIALAVQSEAAAGHAYTIVDVHARQADYVRLYHRLGRVRGRPVYVPVGLLRATAAILERGARALRRRPPITLHQVDRTLFSATFSSRRAREQLGWEPRVPLEEALRRTFAAQAAAS